jgi:RNA polymerase sigma factor (sigma-70 family)
VGDDLPEVSDSALLARVRAGDDAGFEELYRRHAGAVRRYARVCCRDPHTAEDLTAEVFALTLRAVREGGGPDTSVRAYLLTTVRRTAARWVSGVRAELPVAEPGAGASGLHGEPSETQALSRADRSIVLQAFLTLPERWQQVLWHTAVEREPVRRVAPRLGLSANATAVLAFRAREGLREAYLQAHVNASLTGRAECRRYARRLGAHARKPLLRRGNHELRRHLVGCVRCRSAYLELVDLNATLRGVLPVGLAGWFTVSSGIAGTAQFTGPAAGGMASGLLGKAAATVTVALVAVTATGSAPLTGQGPDHHRPAVTAPGESPGPDTVSPLRHRMPSGPPAQRPEPTRGAVPGRTSAVESSDGPAGNPGSASTPDSGTGTARGDDGRNGGEGSDGGDGNGPPEDLCPPGLAGPTCPAAPSPSGPARDPGPPADVLPPGLERSGVTPPPFATESGVPGNGNGIGNGNGNGGTGNGNGGTGGGNGGTGGTGGGNGRNGPPDAPGQDRGRPLAPAAP